MCWPGAWAVILSLPMLRPKKKSPPMLRPKKKNHCPCSGQHKKHCPCSRPLLYSGQARLSAVHQWAKGSNAAGEDRGAAKSSNRRRVPPVFRRTVPDPLGQKRDNSGYALGRGLATAATHQSSMGRSHSKPAYRRTDHPPPSCSTHSACVPAQRSNAPPRPAKKHLNQQPNDDDLLVTRDTRDAAQRLPASMFTPVPQSFFVEKSAAQVRAV